ncbi:MAG: hypothetical protein K6F05_06470 [Succinivibrio sp.]|nr:hypothetical protein [Succinivibrio sp.]
MNRLFSTLGVLLTGSACLMPIHIGQASGRDGLWQDPYASNNVYSGQSLEQLDTQRKSLRQELLNDKAVSTQRQAIAKSRQEESAEDREKRQKLYEESVMQRGESVIAERKALRDHRIKIDADKLRGLASSFSK